MAEIKITKENFEEVVMKAEQPILVDFWAVWCGPCKMLSPIVSEIAEELGGKVAVGKVNVDEEMALAQKFGIMSIPTLVLFKGGQVVGQTIGYQSKEALMKWINEKI